MLMHPLISVVIPTFNCEQYILQAITSVMEQTYRHHEIVVVDDGSTDDTQSVLSCLQDKISYVYQNNKGVVAARNLGIQRARGQLVAFLDADDTWDTRKLEHQVQAIQKYPEAGLVFADFHEFDESGVIAQSRFHGWSKARVWYGTHGDPATEMAFGWIYEDLLTANWIHTSTVLVSKKALAEAGLFDPAFRICQDYDLWLRIARTRPAAYVNRVLCGYRHRTDGLSGTAEARLLRWNQDTVLVLEKHLRLNAVPRKCMSSVKARLSELYWTLAWHHFHHNRLREARRLFLSGLRYRPFCPKNWLYLAAAVLPPRAIEGIRALRHRQLGRIAESGMRLDPR